MFPTIDQRIDATSKPPKRIVIMRQKWYSLLYLHWDFDPAQLQAMLPEGLSIDTHEDRAYIGVVPFYMHGLRLRFGPPAPAVSYFPELNLRTYVYDKNGRPGVWFFSLDAQSHLSVWIAQQAFSLNYHYAKMHYNCSPSGEVNMTCVRRGQEEQRYSYRATKLLGPAQPGSLSYFLAERYYLFAKTKSGSLRIGKIYHAPHTLYDAEVSTYSKKLFYLNGFSEPRSDYVHAVKSPKVDVSIYSLQKI